MSFDQYAKNWDTEKRIERAKIVAKEIDSFIDKNENDSAMEFGCGTGLVSFNLHDRFKSITLVDSSKGMIDILHSKIAQYGVTNMIPYHIDLTRENSLDRKFDVIYHSMVLHHIQEVKSILKEFYALLNEGGYLCIVDLDKEDGRFHKKYPEFDGHNGFDQQVLRKLLKEVGFKEVESNTFFYDEKIIDEEKINYSLFIMKGRK